MSPLAVGFDYTREGDSTPMMGLHIIELLCCARVGACDVSIN